MSAEGDSLFLAFFDAASALAACARAQRDLAAHAWPGPQAPRVRMGVHTGIAEPYAGEYTSPEVHRAARIASAAHGGQVLCSEATARAASARAASARAASGVASAEGAATVGDGLSLDDLGLHRLRGFDDASGSSSSWPPAWCGTSRVPGEWPRPRTISRSR